MLSFDGRMSSAHAGGPSSSPPAYNDADFDVPDYLAAKGSNEVTSASFALYAGLVSHAASESGPSQLPSPSTSRTASAAPASWTSSRGRPWSGTEVRLWDRTERRVHYSVRIPSKREGWKAEVSSVGKDRSAAAVFADEKKQLHEGRPVAQWAPRYEVRREALARRIDFWHQPDGTHNVMVPSSRPAIGTPRAYTCEAPDGQALVWQRNGIDSPRSAPFRTSWTLLSRPSMVVVARYVPSSTSQASSPAGSASPARQARREEHADFQALGEQGSMQGVLTILLLDDARSNVEPVVLQRNFSRTSAGSDEEHARLARAHKRPLCLGLAVPGVLAAAAAAPHMAASWNKHCLYGDDLSNLGRTRVGVKSKSPSADLLPGKAPNTSADPTGTAAQLAALNRSNSTRRRGDVRPRRVEFDFVVASLIAALDA